MPREGRRPPGRLAGWERPRWKRPASTQNGGLSCAESGRRAATAVIGTGARVKFTTPSVFQIAPPNFHRVQLGPGASLPGPQTAARAGSSAGRPECWPAAFGRAAPGGGGSEAGTRDRWNRRAPSPSLEPLTAGVSP